MPKVDYLVVDTTAFIQNTQLQEFSDNVISIQDVIDEIKSKRQLKRLIVLPYDLTVKEVFPENIKTVTEFSKKTGDYPSLSATDLKVIALTYQLEKEHVGDEHIRPEPVCPKSIESYASSTLPPEKLAGFYEPDKFISDDCENEEACEQTEEDATTDSKKSQILIKEEDIGVPVSEEDIGVPVSKEDYKNSPSDNDNNSSEEDDSGLSDNEISEAVDKLNINTSGFTFGDARSESDLKLEKNVIEEFEKLSCEETSLLMKRVNPEEGENEDEVSDTDSIYDDDEYGWITPSNLNDSLRRTGQGILDDEPVKVACLTTDFAMQNVLKQMGLNIISLDGRVIKHVRNYILRCHACFKTTSNMDKLFCPKCGLKTLKKVAVSVDEEGKQHIYINFRRPLTSKGKRFSIPRPRGGKHAQDPLIVEDQRIPQQRLSKKALQKTNALDPDYTAGFSPFALRDTTSRSVMLGFHTRQNAKHLLRNPNFKKSKK